MDPRLVAGLISRVVNRSDRPKESWKLISTNRAGTAGPLELLLLDHKPPCSTLSVASSVPRITRVPVCGFYSVYSEAWLVHRPGFKKFWAPIELLLMSLEESKKGGGKKGGRKGVDNTSRRTWDTDEFEKKAKERAAQVTALTDVT